MENLVIFFCDINGTIEGYKKNSTIDYKEFNILLKKLKEKDDADTLLFSLVSTENKDTVARYSDTFGNYLDSKITMGKQFYDIGYLENDKSSSTVIGKIWQILNYLDELKKDYCIKRIYLAEDMDITTHILAELLEYENKEKFEPIIPINKEGLSEINDIILTKFFVPNKVKKLQHKM